MLVDMIDDLLSLFKRDREFKSYTLDGQMAAVMDYLEVRPDRHNELRNLVRRKKLFIGPWYILADEFLSSGESLIRNLQFGFRMGESLGGVMKIGYIPDQFGHIAQMPQILRGFNIDSAMIYRGFGGEPGQESSEYWWASPDGSRLLMHHLPKDGYSAGYFASNDKQVVLQKFERIRKELDARAQTSQRLFFNGGDHHWPDETVTNAIKILKKQYDAEILHSNFVDYFSALKKELGNKPALPSLSGETRFGYRHAFAVLGGVFSSRMYLKQANAACEMLLERYLEPLNVLAMFEGMKSKTPQIEQAWKYVLQNQDHDAICGTSVDEVHREMVIRYEKAKQIGAHVMTECFAGLLPYDERAYKDDRFVVVFNPSPFARSDVAEAAIEFYLQDVVVGLNPEVAIAKKLPPVSGFRLEDGRGKDVPFQILHREEAFGLTHSKHDYPRQTLVDRFSVLLAAEDIPPMGWNGFKIVRTDSPSQYPSTLRTGKNFIENDFLRVEVRSDGGTTIAEKKTGLVYEQMNIFEDSGDVGDEYNYSYPEKDEWYTSSQFKPTVQVLEQGPLRAALRIDHTMLVPASASSDERSRSNAKAELKISSTLSLNPFSHRVDIKTVVWNNAKDHRLRVLFRTGIDANESYAETPFSVVKRAHREYDVAQFTIEHPAQVAPMQRFVTIHDKQKGLTLITKGLPEYELSVRERGLLALTLLRCVGKLSGRDLTTRPGGAAGWWHETPEAQCLGTHTFEYAVYPHSPSLSDIWSSILREAELFTVSPLALTRKNEQPTLKHSSLTLQPDGLQLSALKESEDKKGIVVRICNPVDRHVKGELHIEKRLASAFLCNLNEEVVRPLHVVKGYDLTIAAKPFEIITIKLLLKKRTRKPSR
jgi:mannosylglycerate hydrolase